MVDAWVRKTIAALFLFILGTFAGVYAERANRRPVIEAPAPAVVQDDGSMILERNPNKPAPSTPELPKGAKVTRITTATIERPQVQSEELNRNNGAITVQLTQIQAADGSSRVIASTEDGRIIGGSDWTGPALPVPKVPRWEVQAIRGWQDGRGAAWGASVGYSRGPWVGSVTLIPGFHLVTAGIGFRW